VPPAVVAAAETVTTDVEKPAAHVTIVAEWQPEVATIRPAVQLEGAGAANTTVGTVEALALVLPEDPEQEDEIIPLTENAPETIAPSYPEYNEEYVAAVEEIFAEWLHAELPDEAEAKEPTEKSQLTPSMPELPLETKAAVHAILEQMTDLMSQLAVPLSPGETQDVTTQSELAFSDIPVRPRGEIDAEGAETKTGTELGALPAQQQLEVWCTQLLETLGLHAEPAAVQALAKRLVFMAPSNQSRLWDVDEALDPDAVYVDPGTHERKQSIITAIRQHVTQVVQRLQRFLAAGRYILASVASPGPGTDSNSI
jgi:hypothetical protein